VENPEDLLYLQVAADAIQIKPVIIAPLVAVPILLLLLILLLGSGTDNKKITVSDIPTKMKKGGKSDDKDEKTSQ